jgi:hypothetical protein
MRFVADVSFYIRFCGVTLRQGDGVCITARNDERPEAQQVAGDARSPLSTLGRHFRAEPVGLTNAVDHPSKAWVRRAPSNCFRTRLAFVSQVIPSGLSSMSAIRRLDLQSRLRQPPLHRADVVDFLSQSPKQGPIVALGQVAGHEAANLLEGERLLAVVMMFRATSASAE